MTDATTVKRSTVSTLRRVIVGIIVVSFSAAAIGGIAVLLGGSIDQTAGRVLTTTAVVGVFSVAVLCCAALAGRRLQPFGLVGAAVAVVTAGLVIALIWSQSSWPDAFWRIMWTGIALTAAASLASLLLLLADRTRRPVRTGLAVTLGLFVLVVALTIYAIWWPETIDGDGFARGLGIAAILAALGAVVVPVLSLLLPDRPSEGSLSTAAVARIEREAAARGIPADALVDSLLAGTSSAGDAGPAAP